MKGIQEVSEMLQTIFNYREKLSISAATSGLRKPFMTSLAADSKKNQRKLGIFSQEQC
jgi:hypothetical protein